MSRSGRLSRQPIMNDIVITGATGVIGRRAVHQLRRAGHRVAGVARSPRGRRALQDLGARAIEADVFDEAAMTAAFRGAGAVVNLLTHIPPPTAWRCPARGTRTTGCAVRRPPRSPGRRRRPAPCGSCRSRSRSSTPTAGTPGSARTRPWRAAARPPRRWPPRATCASSSRATPSSCAWLFIGPDSGLTLTDIERARTGISPSVGRRDAYRPTVWLDDAAAAVAAALEAPAGVYNVADADPPTRGEIDAALAAVVGRSRDSSASPTASSATWVRRRTSCRRPGCGSSARASTRSTTSTPG